MKVALQLAAWMVCGTACAQGPAATPAHQDLPRMLPGVAQGAPDQLPQSFGSRQIAERCAQKGGSYSLLTACIHREATTGSLTQAQSQHRSFFRRHLELIIIVAIAVILVFTFRFDG